MKKTLLPMLSLATIVCLSSNAFANLSVAPNAKSNLRKVLSISGGDLSFGTADITGNDANGGTITLTNNAGTPTVAYDGTILTNTSGHHITNYEPSLGNITIAGTAGQNITLTFSNGTLEQSGTTTATVNDFKLYDSTNAPVTVSSNAATVQAGNYTVGGKATFNADAAEGANDGSYSITITY